MKRLTEEQKKEIRKMQDSGLTDREISNKLGISYGVVNYYRPHVRQRIRKRRERQKLFSKLRKGMTNYQRKRQEQPQPGNVLTYYSDQIYFRSLVEIIEAGENTISEDELPQIEENSYVKILASMKNTKFGLQHRQIASAIGRRGESLQNEMIFLKKGNFVTYHKDRKRYTLDKRGKTFCETMDEYNQTISKNS